MKYYGTIVATHKLLSSVDDDKYILELSLKTISQDKLSLNTRKEDKLYVFIVDKNSGKVLRNSLTFKEKLFKPFKNTQYTSISFSHKYNNENSIPSLKEALLSLGFKVNASRAEVKRHVFGKEQW